MRASVPRIVRLRTGIVLGRGGGALEKISSLFKFYLGGRLGSGRQWMSWIHLDDLVGLYVNALEDSNVNGPVNAVAPQTVTNGEFTRTLAQQLKVAALFPAPKFILKLVLGERSTLLLDSQRVKSPEFSFRYEKLADALRQIFKDVESARGLRAHDLVSTVWWRGPPEELFARQAANQGVESMGPPELKLKRISQSTTRLQEGSSYGFSGRVEGMPFRTESRVVDWVENHRFTTTQVKGPFSFWVHSRKFERLGGGTLFTETVVYRPRFGFLGDLLCHRYLARKLETIFGFRRRALAGEGAAFAVK